MPPEASSMTISTVKTAPAASEANPFLLGLRRDGAGKAVIGQLDAQVVAVARTISSLSERNGIRAAERDQPAAVERERRVGQGRDGSCDGTERQQHQECQQHAKRFFHRVFSFFFPQAIYFFPKVIYNISHFSARCKDGKGIFTGFGKCVIMGGRESCVAGFEAERLPRTVVRAASLDGLARRQKQARTRFPPPRRDFSAFGKDSRIFTSLHFITFVWKGRRFYAFPAGNRHSRTAPY